MATKGERNHGSASRAPSRIKNFWLCHGTDTKGQSCGYMVPKGKAMCYACGHEPPAHVSGKDSAKKAPAKASGKGGKPAGTGDATEQTAAWVCRTCTNRAGDQWRNAGSLKACGKCVVHKGAAFGQKADGNTARAPQPAPSANEQRLAKQLADVKAELAKVQANAPEKEDAAGTMEVDAPEGEASLAAAVDKAYQELQAFKKLPQGLREQLAGYDETLAKLEAAHEAARAAKRGAKPLKQQLAEAEEWHGRAVKRANTAKNALAAQEEQARELAAAIETGRAELKALEVAVTTAKQQVATLGAQRNAECIGEVPPAVAALADTQDVISRDFANRVWAEREAQVESDKAELRRQLEAALSGGASNAADSTPSEGEDIGSIASLDGLAEDDSVWGKCEGDRAQRKRVLARHSASHRAKMANQIKTTFNSLSKTSASTSPFAKK